MSECPCCGWDGDEDDPEPPPLTPEEIAALRAREETRLAERMTPARSPAEQIGRDVERANDLMIAYMNRALYRGDSTSPHGITGLSAVLPS